MSSAGTKTASLLLEQADSVATLTLNRPQARNTLTPALIEELREKVTDLAKREICRVLIIRGAGDKAFSAGFDIGAIGRTREVASDGSVRADGGLDAAFRAIEDAPFPVVAAIRGHCIGGGFELALACDLRIVAEDAGFRMPPAQLGWVYGLSNLSRFVSVLGASRARQVFLLGETIDARTALDWGIAHAVCAPSELDNRVTEITARLSEAAPIALGGLKHGIAALARATVSSEDLALHAEWRRRAFMSADLAEGRAAFLERRKPRFRGR